MSAGRSSRLLFVSAADALHGPTRALLDTVELAVERGLDCTVVLPGDGPAAAWFHHVDAEVIALPRLALIPRNGSPEPAASAPDGPAWSSVAELARVIRHRSIGLVYSNTSALLSGALAARETRRTHVWHVRERFERLGPMARVYARFVVASSQLVLCNSPATAAQFTSREKVRVVDENGNGHGSVGRDRARSVVDHLDRALA